MGANTKIEWATHTFNPWRGCAHKHDEGVLHEACRHCYAAQMAPRNPKTLGVWGPEGTRIKAAPNNVEQVRLWDRNAARDGVRARVFCASLADVFEDWQGPIHDHKGGQLYLSPGNPTRVLADDEDGDCSPNYGDAWLTMDDLRSDLFELIDATPNLDWLLLTKRPENVRAMWEWSPAGALAFRGTRHRRNVWLGTSISDQRTADRYIPELLKMRDLVPVLFLSVEPLLEAIDLGRLVHFHPGYSSPEFQRSAMGRKHIDWVIVGGESGPHARPMHPAWVRSLRDQCQAAGVPFFFKQWGEWGPEGATNPPTLRRVGKRAAGRVLDGRQWSEVPTP